MTTLRSDGPAEIRRRRVYYLPGFDTRSARHYHGLYQTEALRQQAVNGWRYEVGPLEPGPGNSRRWTVHAQSGGTEVHTVYTFLQWNDLVRVHWPQASWRVALGIPAYYAHHFRQGVFARTRRVCKPFFWMQLLPLLYALVGGLLGIAVAAAMFATARRVGLATDGAALLIGLAGLALVLWGTLVLCERQRVYWLMRAWTFFLHWGRSEPTTLRERWDEFARQIDSEFEEDAADETLLIGHSAGSMAAISVAARVCALAAAGQRSGPLPTLVTLGNITPSLALIPEADWFRREMQTVGASAMPWIEYTAPGDPLCYALVNAFSACGLPSPDRKSFLIKSARFDRMFESGAYAAARRNFFLIHFQYLMATHSPVENDYFSLTAGPKRLVVEAIAA